MNNNLSGDGLLAWLRPLLSCPRLIFVAVSGGVDSMVLVTLLNQGFEKLRYSKQYLHILHLNHNLRANASDEDAAFVQAWAKTHHWQFHMESLPIQEMAKNSGQSIETEARFARYAFFERTILNEWQRFENGSDGKKSEGKKPLLFLAHHQDDQVESILLHLFRGAGALGIRGMQGVEQRKEYLLVRPFLGVTKEEIYAFSKKNKVRWREDATNQEVNVERNALRHVILPAIRKHLNRNANEAILRFSTIYSKEDTFLTKEAQACYERIRISGKHESYRFFSDIFRRNAALLGAVSLPRDAFLALPVAIARRVLRNWVEESLMEKEDRSSFSFEQTEQVRRSFELPSGKQMALYGMIFLTDGQGVHQISQARYEALLHRDFDAGSLPISQIQTEAQQISIADFGTFDIRMCPSVPSSGMTFETTPDCAYMDGSHLLALSWRKGKNTDPFLKFGGGSKPLRRMWNEWHVPEVLRANWPVFTDGNKILWVPGFARSGYRPAKVGGQTICIKWRQE